MVSLMLPIMKQQHKNHRKNMKEPDIIDKIKSIRLDRGFSLNQMAKMTGLSKGYLSKIENGLSNPPIVTLYRIASALNVDLTHFFYSEEDQEDLNWHKSIVRGDSRKEVIVNNGETQWKMSPLAEKMPGRNFDPYIIEIPKDNFQVFKYMGEEFYFLLEGKVELEYGNERHVLEAGDSIYIDTSIPYSGRSISEKPAKALLVNYHYRKLGTDLPFSKGLVESKHSSGFDN